MTEIDRTNVLRDLDSRHDELLKDLDVLNQQVELALATLRPPSGEPATTSF